ncbi:T9SS type A sorting domain-containing protein [Chryseobacterium sp. MYb264]|uniref:T9SS type A sorting domain-containing protein n=1 Tax=Chryseobacterium sp. MYb264 TaxID=2745153 RepID=UPI002E14CEA5|nr:T9SS type A sorting domain-containing protein [Chryseobacterium sp. MYb264]
MLKFAFENPSFEKNISGEFFQCTVWVNGKSEVLNSETVPNFVLQQINAYGSANDGIVLIKIIHFLKYYKSKIITFVILFLFRMIKNLFSAGILSILGLMMSTTVVKAQCTAVDVFYENFDSYTAPESIVPTCWDRIALNGASQIISNSQPASGSSQIYQFGYGNGKVSIVIFPQLTTINAGTHQFRFKAKANSGGGALDFGYITDLTDASTFVVLQQVPITNSTYDVTSERTLTVPTTVPANARLAIRNDGSTFAGYYWDDASWEAIPNLATSEPGSPGRVKVYPNPFKNEIYISELKDLEKIIIADAVGRVVRTIEKPVSIVNLDSLKKGIYWITLKYRNGKISSLKTIKQ